MLILLVPGPHFENHCPKPLVLKSGCTVHLLGILKKKKKLVWIHLGISILKLFR